MTTCNKLFASLAIAAGLLVPGCMTTDSQKDVIHNPMTPDLEKQVLAQTGISGALIGGTAAAAAAYGFAYAYAKSQGRSHADAHEAGVRAALPAALAGGWIGYDLGKGEGEKVVAKAMERDQLNKLVNGARAYNREVAAYNDRLRKNISAAQKEGDAQMRKAKLASLKQQAIGESAKARAKLGERSKALGNEQWRSSDKGEYEGGKRTLEREVNELQESIDRINELQKSGDKPF